MNRPITSEREYQTGVHLALIEILVVEIVAERAVVRALERRVEAAPFESEAHRAVHGHFHADTRGRGEALLGGDAGDLRIEIGDARAYDKVRRGVARARERNLQAAVEIRDVDVGNGILGLEQSATRLELRGLMVGHQLEL